MKHEISKMKVLDLQTLADVTGGKEADEAVSPQAWSTMSRAGCDRQNQGNEWSTMSEGCR